MSNEQWTSHQRRYLRSKWGVISLADIAAALGKSVQAVRAVAWRMGLESPPELRFDAVAPRKCHKCRALVIEVDNRSQCRACVVKSMPKQPLVFEGVDTPDGAPTPEEITERMAEIRTGAVVVERKR